MRRGRGGRGGREVVGGREREEEEGGGGESEEEGEEEDVSNYMGTHTFPYVLGRKVLSSVCIWEGLGEEVPFWWHTYLDIFPMVT